MRPIDGTAGPLPGMLTCLPSGERRVFVHSGSVGVDWPGWRSQPDGHILAAHDVVRRVDGHDIVTELCVETLAGFISRRAMERAPLSRGEAVTVGVGVLRGCAELRGAIGVTGEWWLTDSGRPVFAATAGRLPLREASTAILADVARTIALPPAWSQASGVLSEPRSVLEDHTRAEAALFSIAEPAALRGVGIGNGDRGSLATWTSDGSSDESARAQPMWHSVARHIDADLGEFVSRTATELWRRMRGARHHRRAPVILAAAAAITVLAVGLWWPSGTGESSDPMVAEPTRAGESSPRERAPSPSTPPPDATPVPPDGGGLRADRDLEEIAGALLDSLRACEGDDSCRAQFLSGAPVGWGAGATNLDSAQRVVTLIDDLGGVAVLRVDAESGAETPQLIVIGQHDDEWLLRDVHDVEQQPS